MNTQTPISLLSFPSIRTQFLSQHFDEITCFSIFYISASPALEVYDMRRESWYSIEENPSVPRYSRAVVMIGESLSQLTNDTFVATLHRVVRYDPIFLEFFCLFHTFAETIARRNTILSPILPLGAYWCDTGSSVSPRKRCWNNWAIWTWSPSNFLR